MDDLQFQKAEFSDSRPKCAACKSAIENSYFHLAGRVICPVCAERVRAGQQRPENSLVVRGILYGLGVAVACSLVYGIITWTMGIDLSLIAIAVGYIVGRAVRKGSGGLGGRRCQIAAVGLTYFSIVTRMLWGFLGGLFFGALQHGTADLRLWPGAWSNIGSLIALWPIRTIQAGASGIIGLIIIFAGLTQAWRQTARDPRLLMGPYTLSDGSSPA